MAGRQILGSSSLPRSNLNEPGLSCAALFGLGQFHTCRKFKALSSSVLISKMPAEVQCLQSEAAATWGFSGLQSWASAQKPCPSPLMNRPLLFFSSNYVPLPCERESLPSKHCFEATQGFSVRWTKSQQHPKLALWYLILDFQIIL